MPVSISRITFEHHRPAIGIAETRPRISWRFDGNAVGWEQNSYELQIRRGVDHVIETHRVESQDSLLNPWPGNPLDSTEIAFVRVRAYSVGSQIPTPWSNWFTVETGLLSPRDWAGASPIKAKREYDANQPKRPVYFRKKFLVDDNTISSARLYITSLGLYEAEINGQRIGDHVLSPGWQSFNHRHVYNTYDITDAVTNGENAIGVVVGEGWYSGLVFNFCPGGGRNNYGDDVGLIALLVIMLKNGKMIKVPTDDSWEASLGPITDSQIYNGETYDSRLEADIKGWSTASFESQGWWETTELPSLKGQLSSPDGPPVRRMEERRPEQIWESPKGCKIIDFGQNLVGWLRLQVRGPSGTKLIISHAEVLQRGELDREPLRGAKATDTFILNGSGDQILEPHFTFHGFRYAQVDGWPENQDLGLDAITAIVLHSDMEQTGWLETSNPLLNQLHENVRWSMKGNFLTVPTDCPQRDERMGWTADALVFGPTANFLYDCSGFWKGWYRDLGFEMTQNGSMIVPYVIPMVPTDGDLGPDAVCQLEATAVWGDIAVAGPWQIWEAFGDIDMLTEHYKNAQAWVDVGIVRDDTGLWDQTGFQFGDWLDPIAPEGDPGSGATPRHLVADAYLIGMTDLMIKMALTLGDQLKADEYRTQAQKLRKAFESRWLQNGKMAVRSQSAYTLGIYYSLFRRKEDEEATEQMLRSIVKESNYKVGTGFASTWILGHTLTGIGAPADFYKMLLQTDVPSWLYQVARGATTTWERWDSLRPDGSTNDSGMTSFNHYAVGSVADWMHQNIGGISPAIPGWKVVNIAPVPGGGITYAKAKFVSGYGEIRVHWWFEERGMPFEHRDGFHLHVWIPPNSRAIVKMPGTGVKHEIGSGFYQFHDTNLFK